MFTQEFKQQFSQCSQAISEARDADIFLFSDWINDEKADNFIHVVKEEKIVHSNVILILTTNGGDPNAAFRMVRFLKNKYRNGKLIFFIFGRCKSAGTLMALAADEIVMSDFSELGPLDVQIYKDEDVRRESGLNIEQSLTAISDQATEIFRKCVSEILDMSRSDAEQGSFNSLKTAEEIATKITVGLLSPITSQIDPLRIGEISRQARITQEYGHLLSPSLSREGVIERLNSHYPVHGFVIDYEQVKELFSNVSDKQVSLANELERELESILSRHVSVRDESRVICSLESFIEPEMDEPDMPGDNGGGDFDGNGGAPQGKVEEFAVA
jgi:hypothetical protein